MKSTLNLAAQGLRTADTWATYVTKFRIHYEPAEDHEPWVLDAINENTLELSEEIEYHATLEEAVADMPHFLERYGLRFVPRFASSETADWQDDLETWGDCTAEVRLIAPDGGQATDFSLNPEQLRVILAALRDHSNHPPINLG